MYKYKIHKQGNECIVAISDSNLVGSVLENEEIYFQITEDFYGKDECKENGLLEILEKATILNAVGKNTIEFLINNNFISKESILLISGVPHAQAIFT